MKLRQERKTLAFLLGLCYTLGFHGGGTRMTDKREVAAAALREVPSGPLGPELFDAIARHSVSNAFEAAALRRGKHGRLEIYLRQRAQNDTAYPGQWHIPGSILRPGEKWADVMTRLSRGEFMAEIGNRRFVGHVPTNEARGSFISFVYLVDVGQETDEAKWFPVDNMPEPLVDIHEQMFIPLAVAAFKLEEATARLAVLKAQFCDE